jgi:penicillin-binding protein 1A
VGEHPLPPTGAGAPITGQHPPAPPVSVEAPPSSQADRDLAMKAEPSENAVWSAFSFDEPGLYADAAHEVPPAPAMPAHPARRARRGRGFIGWFTAFLVSGIAIPLDLLTLGLAGGAALIYVTLPSLPSTEGLGEVQFQEPLRVYSADGDLMAEFGVQRRRPVVFDKVPPLLVKAFLATEDSRFFEHRGVDVMGLARAALSLARTGSKSQGGSTITMQVARNFFLTPEKTVKRKFSELLLALQVEQRLSKEQILELYLNKIFFGHRAYGVTAAADLYYDKALDDLTLPEMAMLAGLPKAPSSNNPLTNPDRALERRNYVLRRMQELDYITAAEYEAAVAAPDEAKLHQRDVGLQAGYIAEMVRQEMIRRYGDEAYARGFLVTTTVESWLQRSAQDALRVSLLDYDRRHGYRGPEGRVDVAGASDEELDGYLDGITELPLLTAGVVTEAGPKGATVYIGGGRRVKLGLKQVAWAKRFVNENAVGRAPAKVGDAVSAGDLVRVGQNAEGVWYLRQAPGVTGALVSLSPEDGAIGALVGGYVFGDSKFNRAVDARRQPGSSFKPFVYAAALEKGWTPASLVRDEPIQVSLGHGEIWEPENFDHKTMGPIRIRTAIALSRNLAAVNMLQSVELSYATQFATRFGFDLGQLPLGLSMVLGTAEVSPLQMAKAYAVFANGGFRIEPYLIQRIETTAGELVFEAQSPHACSDCWFRYEQTPARTQGLASAPQAERVLDPRLVYEMNSMLQGVVANGTATRAKALNRTDIAGKTGTTNDVRDSWFCGYQKDFVAVAWMGFDDFSRLGKSETGGHAGLGMWMDFMKDALKDKPNAVLPVPEGMVTINVDKARGTETAATGPGVQEETIREELRLTLLGPESVRAPGGSSGASVAPRRTAPRVMDDLF